MIILLYIHPGIHYSDMLFTSIITLDIGKVTLNQLVRGSSPWSVTIYVGLSPDIPHIWV
jgi:hypothetical protein